MAAATTNGVNGHAQDAANGHGHAQDAANGHGHANQEEGQGRTLLIQDASSGSKLSIHGIPIEVFGLADQLRDEFVDYLKNEQRSSRLAVPAPDGDADDAEEEPGSGNASSGTTLNNSPLFLASYWLEFLALQHSDTARPILIASRAFFSSTFLAKGTLDIHTLGGTLSDVEEKKLVLSAWVGVCARIGDGEFGPRGQIWREENGGRVRTYAVFGGQGSNEYYWDEMEVSARSLRRRCRRGPMSELAARSERGQAAERQRCRRRLTLRARVRRSERGCSRAPSEANEDKQSCARYAVKQSEESLKARGPDEHKHPSVGPADEDLTVPG